MNIALVQYLLTNSCVDMEPPSGNKSRRWRSLNMPDTPARFVGRILLNDTLLVSGNAGLVRRPWQAVLGPSRKSIAAG